MAMKYKLVMKREAQEDILDAASWYEDKSTGLGKTYVLSFEKALSLILRNPFSFALIYLKIRKANLNKFPYSLYYSVNQNEITVLAVLHQRRSSKVWKQRLKK